MPFISLPSSRSSIIGSVTISSTSTEGEHQYNIAGTYNWTAPAGVSLVSVVAIGGGAGGSGGWGPGGAGGGLACVRRSSGSPGLDAGWRPGGRAEPGPGGACGGPPHPVPA